MSTIVSEASDERAMHGGRGAAIGRPSRLRRRNAEFAIPLGTKTSAFERRDPRSEEFALVPLGEMMAVLRARETAGTIRLVPRK